MSYLDILITRTLNISRLPRIKAKSDTEYRNRYHHEHKHQPCVEVRWEPAINFADEHDDGNVYKFPNMIGDFKN